jgi:predicted ATP-dependent endonuclease of OLD family
MRLRKLYLENFGPFKNYEVEFPADSSSCILITGKNNAGKTTIIRGLKLISSALKFAGSSPRPIIRELLKKDVRNIDINRMVYQFEAHEATIEATFDNEKSIKVSLDTSNQSIYCEIPPHTHASMSRLFSFLPPLGQLAEQETLLTEKYLLNSLDSSLAPLHLRNHLYHFFSPGQYQQIKEILRDTWEGVELQDCEYDLASGLLTCIYREGLFYNEIAWAGQGLQIWLQIITHLVRLAEYPVLVLDEPEIFLHPKKQHDLIQLLQDHYAGCAIIATHSSELMNNVDISHIIYVQKDSTRSILRKTSDKNALEKVRRNIGSSFNFHASQFEDVEALLMTEHDLDYDVIQKLAFHCGIPIKTQNIKLMGFSHWKDYVHYIDAYYTYFGRHVECSILLDRDYYPEDYLNSIRDTLLASKVKIAFTPGKEIENLFLEQDFLATLLPKEANSVDLFKFLDRIYEGQREMCKSKYAEFARDYSPDKKGKTYSTVLAEISPFFNSNWSDTAQRHNLIPGKPTLAEVRDFFRLKYRINLTTSLLTQKLSSRRRTFVEEFLSQIL